MRRESPGDSNAPDADCQAPDGEPRLWRPTVILVRPREEGNVGAVARAMANTDLHDLLLVEPAPPIGGVARGFGVGGWQVLDAARRTADLADAVAPFRRVVGTTAMRDRPLRRARVVTPRELPEHLAREPGTPTALVFGSEDKGLRRDELELCSLVVRIPTASRHPTLNLAQAVLVVAYELFVAEAPEPSPADCEAEPPATTAEVAGFLAAASQVLDHAAFDQPHIQRSLLRDVRRLTQRSGASSHEVRVLRRVANRLLQRLATR